MILVDNREGLIGDFLGTIPAMQKLAEKDRVVAKIKEEVLGLGDLIVSRNLEIDVYNDYRGDSIILSSGEAFQIASKLNCYMSSAFMVEAGFELPKIPPKAKLNIKELYKNCSNQVCDYLVSPFARSLPEGQKWPKEKWLELFREMPLKKFGVLGNSKYDDLEYFGREWPKNVIRIYDSPFPFLCELYKSVECLISVVTGTSHLAFHLGVKNILLTSQTMAWGNNPDAILIKKPIHEITVKEVMDKL